MPTSQVFVGFASEPSNLADTVRTAAVQIGRIPQVSLQTWEDLRIGGKILLNEIEGAIRTTDVAIFDLTQLNENVLFELGLGIGANRIVWPLRDASDTEQQDAWNTIGLLDTVGQTRFTNSEQIHGAFLKERPDLQGEALFDSELKPQLTGGRPPSVFYFAEPHQSDAGREVLKLLNGRTSPELPLVTADPQETAVETLSWYVQHLYAAEVVVVHLAPLRREGARVHNARASLIAGVSRGLDKPLLMLAEAEYRSALDYRDLLYRYPNASECSTRLNYWLERELLPAEQRLAEARDTAAALRLSTELRSVNLGEYVAENEAQGLQDYYVETATYREVLSGDSRVYVGSKGVGKSATVIRSDTDLRSDKRNLVCTIKPPGYDLNGLVRLLRDFEERDEKGYVAESLWKYLLVTEVALAVEQDLAARPAGVVPQGPEWTLTQFIAKNERWIKADFSSRLETAVENLLSAEKGDGIADRRERVSEALHAGPIRRLRQVLAPALAVRKRVFILIDNLDKGWDKGADIPQLSRLLLGLLASMDSFRRELEQAAGGPRLAISLSLFIRSDIFATVASLAREPDKLPVRRMNWPDEVAVLDVVGQRYVASRQADASPEELWQRYFCPTMDHQPTTSWLVQTCLPRPRDTLFLCRAAIDQAVAKRHSRVEEDDLTAAEAQYSLFAFEVAAVEGQQRVDQIDNVLLEFAGVPTMLSESQLPEILRKGGVNENDIPLVIDVLQDVSFLGLVTARDEAVYTDSPREKQKARILAKRLAENSGSEVMYAVHPAFWSYLEMERGERTLPLRV